MEKWGGENHWKSPFPSIQNWLPFGYQVKKYDYSNIAAKTEWRKTCWNIFGRVLALLFCGFVILSNLGLWFMSCHPFINGGFSIGWWFPNLCIGYGCLYKQTIHLKHGCFGYQEYPPLHDVLDHFSWVQMGCLSKHPIFSNWLLGVPGITGQLRSLLNYACVVKSEWDWGTPPASSPPLPPPPLSRPYQKEGSGHNYQTKPNSFHA